jgi:hypothetical protein
LAAGFSGAVVVAAVGVAVAAAAAATTIGCSPRFFPLGGAADSPMALPLL